MPGPLSLPEVLRLTDDRVAEAAPELLDLSHRIHAHPELGHEEHQAAAWCAEVLARHGFVVERPVAGLATAFRATRITAPGTHPGSVGGRPPLVRPAIAFLAEYDALPGVGHACGHNIIAASTVGAGIALAQLLDAAGQPATIIVDGTPAEETTGGKIPMVGAGLYREVDVVLSMHPETTNGAGGTCLGVRRFEFSFFGRAAHSAAEPEKGINALDAVLQTFAGVNALRQHVRSDVRLHGIITHGGRAVNIVPDFARCEISVRSADLGYLGEVLEKVRDCARGAALATGARLEIVEADTYEPIRRNAALTRLALEAMSELGLDAADWSDVCSMASTDFGNVSQVVPAIAPIVRSAPAGAVLHHPDFATAAGSAMGDAAVLASARLLARVGARLVLDPERLAEVRRDFTGG